MFEKKISNKSKYLKITLVIIIILFVVFVILRKISVDNESQKAQPKVDIQPKNEITAVSDNDKKRIKKLLEDNTSVKSDKIKDELDLKIQVKEQEEQLKKEQELTSNTLDKNVNSEASSFQNSILNENRVENVENSAKTKIDKPTQIQKDEESKIVALVEKANSDSSTQNLTSIQSNNELKAEEKDSETLKEPLKTINKDIDLKFINDIADLKLVKNEISILDSKFEYQNKIFNVGDKFGIFEIITIEDKKIRFKRSDNFFYNLRFY